MFLITVHSHLPTGFSHGHEALTGVFLLPVCDFSGQQM